METLNQPQKMHIGRKICRIREIRGIKQEALAQELGITQQQVSRLEQSETVEEEVLEQIAKVLGVTSDAIHKFNEEAVFNIINNTFSDNSSNNNNYLCTINPLEKIIELYERLLASEREKVEIMKNK
jgi:transcriptional regulator with XRE-family HTH domain